MRIAILLEDFVEEVEFIYPYYRFKEEGFDVLRVAIQNKAYKGKNGLIFYPDEVLKKGDEDIYDMVFIPGGYAPDRLRRSETVLHFVRAIYERGKPVAAICHGPWVLISAGIVRGKKLTGFYAIKDDIVNAGATYTGRPFERDENLFTATDPSAMPEFLKFIIESLKS